MNKTIYLKSATILMSLIMTACTSIPKDGGVSDVESLISDKLNPGVTLPISGQENQFTAQQVDQMISEPLTLMNAERLSISQNPLVKVKLYQVGVAAADYAQAGRMENPGFSYGRFSGGDYDASLLFDVGGVILMPLKRQLESRRLNTAKFRLRSTIWLRCVGLCLQSMSSEPSPRVRLSIYTFRCGTHWVRSSGRLLYTLPEI